MFNKYVRKTFTVQAVRVTKDNINEASKLVGDTVHINIPKYGDRVFFYLPVIGARSYRVEQRVPTFIGDWLTLSNNKYRRYSHEAFVSTFETPESEVSKREAIENYVYAAIAKVTAKGENTLEATKYAADKIMSLG